MLANGIKETSATTGTGTLTLSSVSGFARFAALPVGAVVSYAIKTTGGDWEWGLGTVGAGNTLARTAVLATLVSGAYTAAGAAPLNLSGTSEVICTMQADTQMPAMPHVISSAGSRHVIPDGLQLSSNSKTLAANTPRGSCLRWSCSAAISHLMCEVATAAGSASDRIQLGIYACNPDGSVGGLLARTGDIDPSSTGLKSAAIVGGSVRLPPAWYWWVVMSSVAPAVRAYNAGSANVAPLATPMGQASATLNNRNVVALFNAVGSGWTALPSSLSLLLMQPVSAEFAPIVGATVA